MSSNLDDPRFTAIGLLAEAYTGLMARFAVQFQEHQLSPVEFEVLMRLSRSPGCQLRMTDLAAQTTLSTSGVTRVIDRMERHGLVTRVACPSDRRSSFAMVTEAGRKRLDEVLPGHLELLQRWYVGLLSEEELTRFQGSLRTIRDAVNPCATAGSTDTGSLPAEVPAEAPNGFH